MIEQFFRIELGTKTLGTCRLRKGRTIKSIQVLNPVETELDLMDLWVSVLETDGEKAMSFLNSLLRIKDFADA